MSHVKRASNIDKDFLPIVAMPGAKEAGETRDKARQLCMFFKTGLQTYYHDDEDNRLPDGDYTYLDEKEPAEALAKKQKKQ